MDHILRTPALRDMFPSLPDLMAGKGREGSKGEEGKEGDDGREAGSGGGEGKGRREEQEEEQEGKSPVTAAVASESREAAAHTNSLKAAAGSECKSAQVSSGSATEAAKSKAGSWWGRWTTDDRQNGQEEGRCEANGQNGQRSDPSVCRDLRDAVLAVEQMLLPHDHERGEGGTEGVSGSEGGNERECGASGQGEGEVRDGEMGGVRRGKMLPDPAAALSAVEELLGRVKAVEGGGSAREGERESEDEDAAQWRNRIIMCKVRATLPYGLIKSP